MIAHHKTLSDNTTSIGICSLLIAIGASAYATAGYFDTLISYCDARSNPCTPVVTVEKNAIPHEYRKFETVLPGKGLNKVAGAMVAMLASTLAVGSLSIAAKHREDIDSESSRDENEHRTKQQIQSDLRIAITEIEAEAQVQLHRKLTFDATAEIYLDESPELAEDIAQMRVKAEREAAEEDEREQQEGLRAFELAKYTASGIDLKDIGEETAETIKHYQEPENLLQMLLTAGDVSLIGAKGSGKTTLTAYLLRERIKMGHLIILFNHHAVMTFYNPLYCFGRDVPQELINKPSVMANLEECQLHIAIGLHKCQQLMDYRYTLYKSGKLKGEPAITILFEEMGEYDGIETELKEIRAIIKQNQKLEMESYDGLSLLQVTAAKVPPNIWQQTTKRNLISSRKGEIFTITTTQDDTNKMSGNLQGMQELRKRGIVRIKLIPKPGIDGKQGAVPSGKGELSMPGLTDSKGKLITIKVKVPDLRERLPGSSDEDYFDFGAIATKETGFDLWNFDVTAACETKGLTLVSADSDDELVDVDDNYESEDDEVSSNPQPQNKLQDKSSANQLKEKLIDAVKKEMSIPDIIKQLWNVTPQDKLKYSMALGWVQKIAEDLGIKLSQPHSPHLSETALTIWEIVKAATRYPISFESIRKSRKWSKQPEKQLLIDGLCELISAGKIEGDEERGYTLQEQKQHPETQD